MDFGVILCASGCVSVLGLAFKNAACLMACLTTSSGVLVVGVRNIVITCGCVVHCVAVVAVVVVAVTLDIAAATAVVVVIVEDMPAGAFLVAWVIRHIMF
jgi:hypothetical protein